MKNIVICGDTFSIGIGCHSLQNEPYGSLLAKNFNATLTNYAKGSSTNLSIFLQTKYALEKIKDIDLLIIGVTSFNRVEWFPDGVDTTKVLHLSNVNYHQYPPYGVMTYPYLLENPMKDDPNYKGEMLTENFYGVVDYVDNVMSGKRGGGGYFVKFKNERPERMKLIREYYADVFDERIQRQFDIGIISTAHLLLKRKNINHLVLTYDGEFTEYIDSQNIVNVDFGALSQKYPDDMNTLHFSAEGHRILYEAIMKKIIKNGWNI